MKKKICFFLFILSISLFGNADKKTYNFAVPDGLPSLSISFMVSETETIIGDGDTALVEHYILDSPISYSIEKMPDALVTQLMRRGPDIAIVPSNVAAQLYNRNLGYKIAGTVGWGSFYIVGRRKFDSFDDLKGKDGNKIKIGMIGRGLTPDVVFRKILKENNIDIDNDIEVEYYTNGSELLPLYLSNQLDTIVIAEPALGNIFRREPDTIISFNLNDEWKKLYDSQYGYPQSTLILRESIYEDKELLSKVVELVEKSASDMISQSIGYVREKIYRMYLKDRYENKVKDFTEDSFDYGSTLVSLYHDISDTLERSNINFIKADVIQDEYINYFKAIEEMDNRMIGGKIPDEEIFIKE